MSFVVKSCRREGHRKIVFIDRKMRIVVVGVKVAVS